LDEGNKQIYVMFSTATALERMNTSFNESSVRAHQIWVPLWKSAISATVD